MNFRRHLLVNGTIDQAFYRRTSRRKLTVDGSDDWCSPSLAFFLCKNYAFEPTNVEFEEGPFAESELLLMTSLFITVGSKLKETDYPANKTQEEHWLTKNRKMLSFNDFVSKKQE